MKFLNIAASAAAAVLAVVFTCLGSFSEISDYDVVSGTSIDLEDGVWLVTCEICTPSADNDFGSGSIYVKGRGDTLQSAFEDAGRKSANVLYMGCNQLYIIGQSVKGNEQLREYFLKDDINLRAVTVYSDKKAADTFESGKDDENTRARSLAMAKKVSRFCSENSLPSPRVTEYLKGNTAVTVSKDETPIKAVYENV